MKLKKTIKNQVKKMSFHYLNEKLSDAVYELATGPGDVRSRLFSILPKIILLSGYGLPSELNSQLLWIQNKLTEKNKTDYGYDRGRTLRRMRNSTGSKIAERIVDLQFRIEELIEDEQKTQSEQ
jgi:hypothetical protein